MAHSKIVYFLRHGESEANQKCGYGGSEIRDPALTHLGCLQAAAWGLVSSSWNAELILVSPLQRTLQTALLAFPGNTRLKVSRSLREHGWHENQNRGSPVEALKTRLGALGLDASYVSGLEKLEQPHKLWDPIGEDSLQRDELHKRRKAATKYLDRVVSMYPQRVLVLVSHYCTIKHLTGMSLHNCEAVRVEFTWQGSNWQTSSVVKVESPELPSEVPLIKRFAPQDYNDQVSHIGVIDSEDEFCTMVADGESEGDDGDVVMSEETPSIPRACQAIYATTQFKNASTLILGRSHRHNEVVALLGGGVGRDGYRYCDFGGGLDGGSARFGGKEHKAAERRWPHLGAFRELAEELFGLHGDEARSCAERIWQVSKDCLVGGRPVDHGSHLIFMVPAKAVFDAVAAAMISMVKDPCKYWNGSPGSCRKGARCKFSHGESEKPHSGNDVGIDAVAKRFVPNGEVTDLKMFSIRDLHACTEPDVRTARSLVPVWTSSRHGRVRTYPDEDQLRIESAYQLRDDTGVSVLNGASLVYPISMRHYTLRNKKERIVARNEEVSIRKALVGPTGSLASCMRYLTKDALDTLD